MKNQSDILVTTIFFIYFTFFAINNSVANAFTNNNATCHVKNDNRLDCYPGGGASKEGCLERGCCWMTQELIKESNIGIPWCYFKANNSAGYQTISIIKDDNRVIVKLTRNDSSYIPGDVNFLQLVTKYETDTRLRITITDSKNPDRFQIPQELVKRPAYKDVPATNNKTYCVKINEGDFNLEITRSDGRPLLKVNSDNMIFADQLIQITYSVPSKTLFGLGEHVHDFRYDLNKWETVAMFAHDQLVSNDINLYGDQPFYIMREDDGSFHGVVLMNSNAKEVALQPAPYVTWRTIGGIFDLYMFTGPGPYDVVKQYLQLIGRPIMVPQWALGFHLCRWGYNSSETTWNLVKKLRNLDFPQDVQWNDLDYMRKTLDFTLSDDFGTLPDMIHDLHAHNQSYIMILDPAISNTQPAGTYEAFDEGMAAHVWINSSDGTTPLEGSVWPGHTYYPDFTNNKTLEWWTNQFQAAHRNFNFDGVWIDMNEPSNFVDGSTLGCNDSDLLNMPPYKPALVGDKLYSKTLCMDAHQKLGNHYNLHSLYGHSEAIATYKTLKKVLNGKRPFILSRSTFVSTGHYSAHWLGDNTATWKDLRDSISGILSFNMFGIPMVGADICGFQGNTNEELCTRWMQLGAFYPFMRNHNTKETIAQDPSVWSEAARNSMKEYIMLRYSLLPYTYTLHAMASMYGDMVVRPLSFEFPNDLNTLLVEDQFMFGPAIMVAPIVQQSQTERNVYFPVGVWYDKNGEIFIKASSGTLFLVQADLYTMPVFQLGGQIIVTQTPGKTLIGTKSSHFICNIYLSEQVRHFNVSLYVDDGITHSSLSDGKYLLYNLAVTQETSETGQVNGWPLVDAYNGTIPALKVVQIYGICRAPGNIILNGIRIPFTFYKDKCQLIIDYLAISLRGSFYLAWI